MTGARLALADGGDPRLGSLPSPQKRDDRAESKGRSTAPWEAPFVWLVWTAMTAIVLGSVYVYASRIPFLDDWDAIVPALTGEQPVTLIWLWSPHNEHRIFLPRLVMLGLLKLSGGDFRIGAWFNATVLAAVAALAIQSAKQIRGTTAFADAIFPLLMLHLRHYENILWMDQTQVVIPIACSLIALFTTTGFRRNSSSARLLGCGIALLPIPLCGAFALPIAFLMGLWLSIVAAGRCRQDRGDKRALVAAVLAAATLAVCIVYLIGLERAAPADSSLATRASFVMRLLFSSVGSAGVSWMGTVQGTMLLFTLFAFAILIWRWFQVTADRPRTVGIAVFLASALAILAAIASGRDANVLPSRYFLLLIPVPIAVYFIFVLAESDLAPFTAHRLATTLLFLVVLLLDLTSFEPFANASSAFMENRLKFETGMEAQVPLPRLLAAYGTNLFLSREYLYREMTGLSKAGVGPFRDYRPDADYRTEDFKLDSTTLKATYWDRTGTVQEPCPIAWNNGSAMIQNGPGRIIQLAIPVGTPGPRFVRGIRLRYSFDTVDTLLGATGFNLQWVRANDPKLFSETEFVDKGWHPRDKPLTLFIDDQVSQVSIFPRGPFRSVTIRGIELCLPVGERK